MSDADPAALGGWRWRAVAGSVLLAALAYLGFALASGGREVLATLRQVGASGIAVALALSLVNYGLRFVRWQAYLGAMGHPVPALPSLRIYLAGFALTTTPGKAGEALRGVLLRRWGVPYPASLAAFLSERLSDLLAVVALALLGLAGHPAAWPLVAVGGAAVLALFALLANGARLERLQARCAAGHGRLPALLAQALQILLQARRCHAPGLLARAIALSLVAWAAEAWAFHRVLDAIGHPVPPTQACFVYAVSMLAGALSFLPGGLGGAEGTMVGLLVLDGVPAADAVAATIVIRVATLWFAVLLGAAAFALGRWSAPAARGGPDP